GVAYAGGRWNETGARMDFIRFSGELFIYYVLIALGGVVLIGFTVGMFETIGVDMEPVLERWIVPCGALGAVVIAAWLVEAKQSVIENMAPVLTRLFTPLFALVLLEFLVTLTLMGAGPAFDRGLARGGEAERHREHGARAHAAVHAVVRPRAACVPRHHDADGTRPRFPSRAAHRVRPAARRRPRPARLRHFRPRPAGARERVRPAAGRAPDQCAAGRRSRVVDHRGAHQRARLYAEPCGRARRERHPAREPRVVGRALPPVPARPRADRGSRALADELRARLCRVGGARRDRVPAAVRVHLRPLSSPAGDPR